MKVKEYEPIYDGTVIMLDDGLDPLRRTESSHGYTYRGAAILVIASGRVSQDNASRAAAQMVGVKAIAGPRRVTLEHKRIKTVQDAQDVADEFVYRLNRVIKQRASHADKLDVRSGAVKKRSFRK